MPRGVKSDFVQVRIATSFHQPCFYDFTVAVDMQTDYDWTTYLPFCYVSLNVDSYRFNWTYIFD